MARGISPARLGSFCPSEPAPGRKSQVGRRMLNALIRYDLKSQPIEARLSDVNAGWRRAFRPRPPPFACHDVSFRRRGVLLNGGRARAILTSQGYCASWPSLGPASTAATGGHSLALRPRPAAPGADQAPRSRWAIGPLHPSTGFRRGRQQGADIARIMNYGKLWKSSPAPPFYWLSLASGLLNRAPAHLAADRAAPGVFGRASESKSPGGNY